MLEGLSFVMDDVGGVINELHKNVLRRGNIVFISGATVDWSIVKLAYHFKR
jgi:hypothetical protein